MTSRRGPAVRLAPVAWTVRSSISSTDPGALHSRRYAEPLREALSRTEQVAGQARLVALFQVALVDTRIVTSGSKYACERRRQVTAIRTGTIDPDRTTPHTTPAHPDEARCSEPGSFERRRRVSQGLGHSPR